MTPISETSIQYLKGVGPSKAKLFANLGISTIEDVLYFFPRRYEDRRQIIPLAQVELQTPQTVTGKIISAKSRRSWHTKKHVTEVIIDDESGRLTCVWFNQPYLENYLRLGQSIVCHGQANTYKNRIQMISPEYEVINEKEGEESLSMRRIVPVYPLTSGISQRYLRKTVHGAVEKYHDQLIDELPVDLRNKYRLANIKRSIRNVHFPENFEDQEEALKRVSFEEFFFFQISVVLRRLSIIEKTGTAHTIKGEDGLRFLSAFPFELTKAQKRSINEIQEDMERTRPMLRLLQGDVGSGKTIVALFGCLMAARNSKQSAFMAPTEILARQHFENIKKTLKESTFKNVEVGLLVNGISAAERAETLRRLKEGALHIVVGTHALISQDVEFHDLSFVVIDEQHKFGVRQRALLTEKGSNPDVLIMTATPIPRTLCITLFGDLDVSVLDELPKGRGAIETRHFFENQAKQAYSIVRENLKAGRQAYIVYPIIDESETLDMKSAQAMYKDLSNKEFKEYTVGLVHGQLKKETLQKTMQAFKAGKIDVLVATTVLEVGVDVPNATVMVIEHAARFGLAQLHQLRGRIGRGAYHSQCLLIDNPSNEEAKARIDVIVESLDGFKIAEKDLELRGPGHFFGRHQHGLNELKVANPASQMDMLELARKEALALTNEDPKLEKEGHSHILNVVKRRYPNYLAMLQAG